MSGVRRERPLLRSSLYSLLSDSGVARCHSRSRNSSFSQASPFQPKRLQELEKENTWLRKLVVDLSLDNAILKEAAYPEC